MGDGPYRVGNHSPLNVWREPGQSTTEQVCMATSPQWAGRIVTALNEQDAHSVGEQAVSDAVASAHLSGVDLPADWVETLGKVASGEVTADDAVQAVVDGSLRDQIVAELATHSYLGSDSCDCGTWRADKLWDVAWNDQWRMHVAESIVDFRVAPMLAAKDAALGWEQTSKQLTEVTEDGTQ
jgi:hypothetical protein